MDVLPPDTGYRPFPPLPRNMPCPICGHAAHAPFVCNTRDGVVRDRSVLVDGDTATDADYDTSREPCPCRLVPIPGVLP